MIFPTLPRSFLKCICSKLITIWLLTNIFKIKSNQIFIIPTSRPVERGGQKRSLSGGPGTQGGPRFRIVRFRMQNSSAQTAGAMMFFFLFWAESRISADAMTLFCSSLQMWSRNLNICEGYDRFFAHHLILGRNSNICERYDLFFVHHVILGHH